MHCHDAVGRSKCYVFTVCLSGYQWPHITFMPLVHFWRCNDLKAVLYLDDGIFSVQGEDRAKVASLLFKIGQRCACVREVRCLSARQHSSSGIEDMLLGNT